MPANRRIDDQLKDARTFIGVALADEEILADFTAKKRDAAHFEHARGLHDRALAAQQAYARERGETDDAVEVKGETWEAAHDAYMAHLGFARVLFEDDAGADEALALRGRRKKDLAGWTGQATQFYDNLLANEEYLERMADNGIDAAALTSARAAVAAVDTADERLQREEGEDSAAKQERDALLGALAEWFSEIRALARIIFEKKPHALRKLGL